MVNTRNSLAQIALLTAGWSVASAACTSAPVRSADNLREQASAPLGDVSTPRTSDAESELSATAPRAGPWTLEAVLERIASASPTVARAQTRIDEARAAVREARASYWPELSLNFNYVATDEPAQAFALLLNQERLNFGPGFDATPGTIDNWREEVRLDWALFAPGRAQQRAAAREGEQAASLFGAAIENRLLNAGVQAWLGLRAALELERVAWSSVETVEQRVAVTRKRFDEGAALRADVLRLEVRSAAARDEAARARRDVERARNALGALMDVHAEELAELDSAEVSVGEGLEGELDELLERAARERSDLAGLAHRARLEGYSRQANEAERLPVLGMFASYAIDNQDLRVDTDLDKYVVGVGLRLPLSARTAPRIDGARARERGALLELRSLALDIEREVRDAWSDQSAARQTLELSEAAVAAAEEAFRVLALAQDSGGATVTDVLEAQDALNRARVRRVAAGAGVQLARARLVAAIGGVR
jgi:outer membrane protein TolC